MQFITGEKLAGSLVQKDETELLLSSVSAAHELAESVSKCQRLSPMPLRWEAATEKRLVKIIDFGEPGDP
jgi:hypothetical protein